MAIRDIFKVNLKTFLNPSAWIDLGGLISQNQSLYKVLKTSFTAEAPAKPESFEEAMKKRGLTEKDVQEGAATYRALAFVFFILGLGSMFYAGLLIIRHSSFLGMVLGLAVTGLLFSEAFRYDFWALQMRQRRLGMTFEDWKRHYLGK